MASENESLLELLKKTSSDKVAKSISKDTPPSKEHLDGLERQDEYFLSKHIKRIKIAGLYSLAFLSIAVSLVITCLIVWVIFNWFGNIAADAKKIESFLNSTMTLILTVLSTLFLNYVLTKKK
ncbi:hypothetical protein A9Q74_03575 [Colwellia sp. 39_35_sub15_T18]|nr:hypothetical protein A9Q74_03575 [Colwellia sp. 39_35_sub15_T18]